MQIAICGEEQFANNQPQINRLQTEKPHHELCKSYTKTKWNRQNELGHIIGTIACFLVFTRPFSN